jgi:putative transcriptional regulator
MPVRAFSSDEVKSIRQAANMTQTIFAACLGVSKKTVEAWESGRNQPSGAASRLLSVMEDDPFVFERYGLFIRQA